MRRIIRSSCHFERYQRQIFGTLLAQGHWAFDVIEERHVEQLGYRPIQPDPFDHRAAFEIDDLDAAPGLAVLGFQVLLELEAVKPFVTRLR